MFVTVVQNSPILMIFSRKCQCQQLLRKRSKSPRFSTFLRFRTKKCCIFRKWFLNSFKNKKRYDDSLKRIPLGRWGTPEDMGELACFLCSDGASYITGQMITSDGGMSL